MITTTAFAGKYQDCATELVRTAQNGQSAKAIFEDLAKASLNDLKSELNSDDQKFAFWMNLYNGAVQHLLTENPNLFEDRSKFFRCASLDLPLTVTPSGHKSLSK